MRANLLLIYLAVCIPPALAAVQPSSCTPAKHDPSESRETLVLDTSAIHALYMDGEFESAIRQLENASSKGLLKSHADSVFAYKHLGVMYAAQYETMEKGKGYMYRLLTIEPTVKILDMYASEMIYMIFRNVQGEFQLRTADPKTFSPIPAPVKTDSVNRKATVGAVRHRSWPYWTAGALTLAGAGLAAYLLIQEQPPQSSHYYGGL